MPSARWGTRVARLLAATALAGAWGCGASAATVGSDSGTGAGAGAQGAADAGAPTGADASAGIDAAAQAGLDASGGSDASADQGAPDATTGGADAGKPPRDAAAGGALEAGSAAGDGGMSAPCVSDPSLPAEPVIPPACATLQASLAVAVDGVPSEASFDTSRIQAALDACKSGQAVRLTAGGGNNAFITGPLKVPGGVTLWVDAGATLYGTRDPSVYGSASALISVTGDGAGIMGDGVIDGQGGEPNVGSTSSFWDANGNGGSSPALIQVAGATNFTLYRVTLHDAPMFHVKLAAKGFVVWGVTIKTPSKAMNSAGTALTPSVAHNTDGVDPGESASDGFIVCNDISDGDDHIAIKGGTSVSNLTIAHNHFLAGHGMSIGSETNGGVSGVTVYDLSIDGTGSGLGGGSSNGIRIKSDQSRGGLVTGITYRDVCVRGLANPIILNPMYSTTATGTLIPTFTDILIQDFHSVGTAVSSTVTLEGFDSSHVTGVTLDNVVVDGTPKVVAGNANVTLGPGDVSFTPSGSGVTVTDDIAGTSTPNPCTGKFVTF